MDGKRILLSLTIAVSASSGVAHAVPPPGTGTTSPDSHAQDMENLRQMELLEEQRRREADRQHGSQVAKFMAAIKSRKNRFPDFDRVVLHGNARVTPSMLELMAGSPYAADIAYYLGKHPEESAAIAVMKPDQASLAIHQIEASIAPENHALKTASDVPTREEP